jgi:hypothetical protein
MKFMNAKMNSVSKPIAIDQYYCDSPNGCANEVLSQSFPIANFKKRF